MLCGCLKDFVSLIQRCDERPYEVVRHQGIYCIAVWLDFCLPLAFGKRDGRFCAVLSRGVCARVDHPAWAITRYADDF